QEFRSGLWVKDELAFVNIAHVSPDARLHGVRIYEFDTGYQLRSISEAATGEFDLSGNWRLTEVVQTHFDGESARVERLAEAEWRSALNPDILSVLLVVPERMSLMNLYLYIRHLADNQQKTERYEIALWKKVIYPLAILVMMALALPFAYLQDRMGAVSIKVFAGIMLGIGFHMLNGLFSSLGVINNWTPAIAAITPSALFLFGTAGFLWWSERR
ncbi:MAG: LptF/LptG family permease, partial [Rhodocyclaceae bacterium]|nr:LptF/LptG family permease [Rhodocyclaceae bacterium]